MAHTKGPWRVFIAGSEGCRILPDTGDKREDLKSIAMVNGRDFLTDADNAVLIAAAPDLLEALVLAHRELIQSRVIDTERGELIDVMWAAIQKAEGK